MFYPKKSFFIFLKITVLTLVSVQLSFSQCSANLVNLGGAGLPLNNNLTHGTYFGFTNAQTTPVISANITNMYNTADQVAENYYSLDQGATSSMWFLRVRGLNNSVSLDFGGCTYTFTVIEQKELNFDLNHTINHTMAVKLLIFLPKEVGFRLVKYMEIMFILI